MVLPGPHNSGLTRRQTDSNGEAAYRMPDQESPKLTTVTENQGSLRSCHSPEEPQQTGTLHYPISGEDPGTAKDSGQNPIESGVTFRLQEGSSNRSATVAEEP